MNRAQANGLLVLAAFLWGAGNVAQKTVLNDIGPLTAVGARCLIATLILAPVFAQFDAKPGTGKIQTNVLKTYGLEAAKLKSASMVVATFAVAITLYQIASGLTTVTNTGFLVNTSIVITPVAAWFLLRQKPGLMIWPAGFLTLSGAYMMSAGMLSEPNLGDILAIISALIYSFWMIFLGRFVTLYGQAGLITLVQFAVTGVICLALGLWIEPVSIAGFNAALPELLMLGIASTGAGYLLQAIAQTHTCASEAAVIVSGEAIFGAIFAFALLGETLGSRGLLGATLIVAGIGLVQLNFSFKSARKPDGLPIKGSRS